MTSTTSFRSDTAAQRAARPGIGAGLLLVLALLQAVTPFATDLYLPAFPAMTADLSTSATGVQLTLTAFLVGIAAGQLVFGPLSDRYGRRTPLVVGAVIFVLSSAAAVVAPTVGVLIAARVVQGLSGAAGMVLGRAVISDLAVGPAAARAMSLMMIVGGVAPVVAPLIGGVIADPLGWRGVLAVVAVIALASLVAVVFGVRESLPRERRDAMRADKAREGSALAPLATWGYLGYTLAFAFGFGVMMAYISASPFIYQTMMGLGTLEYSLLFGVNALALMVVSAASAKLVDRVPAERLMGLGLGISAVGAALFLLIAATGAPVWLLAVAVFVAVAPLGLVLGNGSALALAAVPRAAGSASAVLGAAQFGLAAVISPLVSVAGEDTAMPCAIVMVASAAAALAAYGVARRAGRA
ncbi:multidrug effflux MFS transporter [Microbacterium indicum]|uniref:multidrug effflux MFS transporter n=1 Tax=Microbacterium indicum TaxID=358100 RepID=UPI000415327D|nr:multidrug effflux MFS transporter [Microbacterium indicum]